MVGLLSLDVILDLSGVVRQNLPAVFKIVDK